MRRDIEFRNLDVDERLRQSKNKKKQFESKLYLENLRRELSRGGEIITLMKERSEMSNNDMRMSQSEVACILKESGIRGENVEGITFNPYRSGQVEIQFKRGVNVDVAKMEEVILAKDLKIEISPFDHIEEVVTIKGIPLSEDMEGLKGAIEETVKAFVVRVKRIEACKYRDGDEFFKNKYNGIWKVVVEPKKGCHIPNFIVVGREAKVQGQVMYRKKYEHRPEMCSDCFEEDHLRGDRECQGVLPWQEYCDLFEAKWQEESRKKGEPGVRVVSRRTVELESRIKEVETENKHLRERVGKKIEPEAVKTMQETMTKMQTQINQLMNEKSEREKEVKSRDKLLEQKENENKKLRDQIRKKEFRDKSEEDARVKRNLTVEYENAKKTSKMSESIEKSSYEWNIPKRLPKKDQIVWIEKDKLPYETKVLKTADRSDGNKFVVFETKNPQKTWTIEPDKHLWQYEKPLCNESPNSSALESQITSTPEDQMGSAGGGLKKSFMDKLNPKK